MKIFHTAIYYVGFFLCSGRNFPPRASNKTLCCFSQKCFLRPRFEIRVKLFTDFNYNCVYFLQSVSSAAVECFAVDFHATMFHWNFVHRCRFDFHWSCAHMRVSSFANIFRFEGITKEAHFGHSRNLLDSAWTFITIVFFSTPLFEHFSVDNFFSLSLPFLF